METCHQFAFRLAEVKGGTIGFSQGADEKNQKGKGHEEIVRVAEQGKDIPVENGGALLTDNLHEIGMEPAIITTVMAVMSMGIS
jgi:hypothetical protein